MDYEKNTHSVPLLAGHKENTDISYNTELSSTTSADDIKRAKRNVQKGHRKIVSSPVHFIAWEQKQQEKLEKEKQEKLEKERQEKLQSEKIERQQKEEHQEEQRKHHIRQTSVPKEVELNVIQKITRRIRSKSQSIENRQVDRYLPELREISVEKLNSLDKVFDIVDRGNNSRMNDQRAYMSPELSNYFAKILVEVNSPKDDPQITTAVIPDATVTINS